ncbi:hypothetical protein H0H92_008606 [Tricholoma furcatifolium]|nr:hypothetical protein H0H92_008606 [Tricholoma furcatifolium]
MMDFVKLKHSRRCRRAGDNETQWVLWGIDDAQDLCENLLLVLLASALSQRVNHDEKRALRRNNF